MVMISDRPAEADDRAVPGHWEGDLIIGKNGRSAVGTLVERTTGYVFLLHMPHGKEAEKVDLAIRGAVAKLPGEFFRTITWDQGKEMAKHASFSIDTGPRSTSATRTAPRSGPPTRTPTDCCASTRPRAQTSVLAESDLDTMARSLNDRPRKRLGYMKPSERLAELLAMTG